MTNLDHGTAPSSVRFRIEGVMHHAMLVRHMKATRSRTLRLRPRALFSEEVMLDVDVETRR